MKTTSKIKIHKAESRGSADHGWLKAKHTFSFAGYYDEDRIQFGDLRVLNDDVVAPGNGFGMHPHKNMEIITIPLEGALKHQDSMGHASIIRSGDVQVMSAGSGLMHSEFNASQTELINLLQIWVLPKKMNIEPRYGEKTFDQTKMDNAWLNIVAPEGDTGDALQINQDAWFSIGKFDAGKHMTYQKKRTENGIYVFVIDGAIQCNQVELTKRDAAGFVDTDTIDIVYRIKPMYW